MSFTVEDGQIVPKESARTVREKLEAIARAKGATWDEIKDLDALAFAQLFYGTDR